MVIPSGMVEGAAQAHGARSSGRSLYDNNVTGRFRPGVGYGDYDRGNRHGQRSVFQTRRFRAFLLIRVSNFLNGTYLFLLAPTVTKANRPDPLSITHSFPVPEPQRYSVAHKWRPDRHR